MRQTFTLLIGTLLSFSVWAQDAVQTEIPADPLSAEVAQVLASDMGTAKTSAIESGVTETKAAEIAKVDDSKKSEAEIPVLTKTAKVAESSSNPIMRVFLSLGIIAAIGLGLVMFSKWWSKTGKKDISNNKIKVVTQHFLGPKKSLAIVRVAGESILIGITDQNISMLKSLSLLDEDEIPAEVPGKFSAALSKASADDSEDFAFSNIKDKISSTVRNMRPL